MRDSLGREINYMRLSVTDRCNLHCRYCMPDVPEHLPACDILQRDELLRICGLAVELGITRFKVTGGEPLVRGDCVKLIRALKELPGVEQVTITTNGTLLPRYLDELCAAGIDGITISLDSLNPDTYEAITDCDGAIVAELRKTLDACCAAGIRTKVNAVLLEQNRQDILPLTELARTAPIDVRFIEQMPIGNGKNGIFVPSDEALCLLRQSFPDLRETQARRGNGPARYYESAVLLGKIGIIDAVSNKFCASCNRIRLTSIGWLKPCLCYDSGADLRKLLRSGASDGEIRSAMEQQILRKPDGHCFENTESITERRTMAQIGG